MTYTISQVAKLMNLPVSTLRYYDNQGLLPFITRKDSGVRLFHDSDISMLQLIECLKKTGMPIKEIRIFTEWVKEGDLSIEKRYQMFLERKIAVLKQIEELNDSLSVINHKCNYYKKAVEAGTENIHKSLVNNQEV